MKGKRQSHGRSGGLHINIRVSPEEKNRVAEQAPLSGLTVPEYMRRRFFGGRPIIAKADLAMIAELRQLGGLLKSHFDLLRKVGAKPEIMQQMECTLWQLRHAAEIVGLQS